MKLVELQGATTAPCGYKWYSNNKSRFNGEYEHYLIKEDKKMTREDKLYSMTMANLQIVADKLGVKINPKAAKSKAVEKILEAENVMEATNKEMEKQEQEKEDLKAAEQETKEQVKEQEPKLVPMPGTEDPDWGKKHYAPTPKRGQLIEYNGKAQNICAWAKELGKSANTLYARIYKLGWDVEKAFNA